MFLFSMKGAFPKGKKGVVLKVFQSWSGSCDLFWCIVKTDILTLERSSRV